MFPRGVGRLQRFLPAVSKGDKRIILVDGEYAGAIKSRASGRPTSGPTWCGAARQEATDLTSREKEICERIGPELQRRGLIFVGIDVIDGLLTEINVTSPDGAARDQAQPGGRTSRR